MCLSCMNIPVQVVWLRDVFGKADVPSEVLVDNNNIVQLLPEFVVPKTLKINCIQFSLIFYSLKSAVLFLFYLHFGCNWTLTLRFSSNGKSIFPLYLADIPRVSCYPFIARVRNKPHWYWHNWHPAILWQLLLIFIFTVLKSCYGKIIFICNKAYHCLTLDNNIV